MENNEIDKGKNNASKGKVIITIVAAIIIPILGYFFVGKFNAQKLSAETEHLNTLNRIADINLKTLGLLNTLQAKKTSLELEGQKTTNLLQEIESKFRESMLDLELSKKTSSTTVDVASLIKLAYPQITLKHVNTCYLDDDTVQVKFKLYNAGELPVNIDYPHLQIELPNNEVFGVKGEKYEYFGPYYNYAAKESENIFFYFHFKDGQIPSLFHVKIKFGYRVPENALKMVKKFVDNQKFPLKEFEDLAQGTYTMDYKFAQLPALDACK